MSELKPSVTFKVADGSLYAMLVVIHQLWQYYSGTRDPKTLGLMALQMEASLKEDIYRREDYQNLVDGLTPKIEDLVTAFRQYATHLSHAEQEAMLDTIVFDHEAELRQIKRAVSGIGNQVALRRRESISRILYTLAKDMVDAGCGDEAEINAQNFLWAMNNWGREEANSDLLQELEMRFGLVYLAKLFTIFALNDTLPRSHQVSLEKLALGGSHKYGRAAENGTQIYRCYYDKRGPCCCGNRPPAEGVKLIKERIKYPEGQQGEWKHLVCEVSVQQLDRFMTVVYGDRNSAQGLDRGPDRASHEFTSEFWFGIFQIQCGGFRGVAKQYGELTHTQDRRFGKSLERDDGQPLSDQAIAQIFRHAAIDPFIWGPLSPAAYGARFKPGVDRAMQHFVDRLNSNPGRACDYVLETFGA